MLRIKIHERLNEELRPVVVGDQIWASVDVSSIIDDHNGWLDGKRYASYWSSTPYVGMNKTMAYGMTISYFNKRVHAFLATDNLRVRLIKE